jgi:hypothetical protein
MEPRGEGREYQAGVTSSSVPPVRQRLTILL